MTFLIRTFTNVDFRVSNLANLNLHLGKRNRNVRVGCIVLCYNISWRGLTRVAYLDEGAMREPETWDKREVVTPTSFIYYLKQKPKLGWSIGDVISMKRKTVPSLFLIIIQWVMICSCSSNLNPIVDKHFDNEGLLLSDYKDSVAFKPILPNRVKFFVEVSGSMNGFFRANRPTQFKADVWNILSYYSDLSQDVTILTNDGNQGASYSQKDFQVLMNTGQFISTASTKVPLMLKSIMEELNTEAGEVGILISDMKYSPVGDAAPKVLMTQYSTDISNIVGKYGKAVCLIGAISDYVDKTGNILCTRSPYYYLVIGNPQQVAMMRNGISALLENNHHFIDNIESGFEYGHAQYSFGIPVKCEQLMDEPTFCNYEEPDELDTCTVKLKIRLDNYRWLISNKSIFEQCFKAKTLHGSKLKVVVDSVVNQNITDKELKRTSLAVVELKIFNMLQDADVVEWTISLPDTAAPLFQEFFDGAEYEDDVTKSYSVNDFLKGLFYGGVINHDLLPNYILITKNI